MVQANALAMDMLLEQQVRIEQLVVAKLHCVVECE